MRVYWGQAGLHIDAEGQDDRMGVLAIENLIRTLEGVKVHEENREIGFSSPGVFTPLMGSQAASDKHS